MRTLKIVLLALVVALLAMTFALMAPSEVDARCYPAYLLSQDTEGPEPIPGGGTATAKAEVRGWIAPLLACFHGEVKSNTTRTIDYLSVAGWFYQKGTFGGYQLVQSGYDYCYNCDDCDWESKAFWASGGPLGLRTKGIHGFSEGTWWWQPTTEALYSYYVP